MARISIVIGHSHSLKEKRMVIRRMKDRVRDALGVAIAEVGEQDVWQRAELGVAVASGDRAKALEVIDEVVRVIGGRRRRHRRDREGRVDVYGSDLVGP